MSVHIRPLCAANQAAATKAFQGVLECVTDPAARASDFPCLTDTAEQELVLDGTLDLDDLRDHPPEIVLRLRRDPFLPKDADLPARPPWSAPSSSAFCRELLL